MSQAHKFQQAIKWIVYTLLLINFVFYIVEDWTRAQHVLTPASTLFDWTKEFATSIDEAAWFFLLFMFELETYILGDKVWKGWVAHTVRGIRIVCYVMIAHTVVANVDAVADLTSVQPIENVSSLCELSNDNLSYVYNLEYSEIGTGNCSDLSTATQFYMIADDPVVTDIAGLELEQDLAWVDVAEVIAWLIIIAAIEAVVRLQSRGVTTGSTIVTATRIKYIMYASLIGMGVYWAWLGHWLYLWDEMVWIGGFAAIEMNVSEWRDEILEEKGVAS